MEATGARSRRWVVSRFRYSGTATPESLVEVGVSRLDLNCLVYQHCSSCESPART